MARSGESVSYGEYEARCNRAAHLLRAAGLRRGDHIAVFIENQPRLLEIEGAAERIGLYYTLINTYLMPDEVAYIVTNSRSRLLFSSAARRPVAEAAARQCPQLERLLMTGPGEPPAGWESYEAAVAGYPAEPVPDESLGAAMLYSSGTTGQPKGVLRDLPEIAPERAAAGDGIRARDVRVPGRHDLPQPGPAVPLGSAGERGRVAAARRHDGGDGALRGRAVAGPGRAVPGHPLPDGAGHVQPAAPAARGGPGPLRHLVAGVHRARRRALPGARQAGR